MTDIARLQAAIRGECEPPRWWIGEPLPMDPEASWDAGVPLRQYLAFDKRQPYGPPELIEAEDHELARCDAYRRHGIRERKHQSVRLLRA